MLPRPNQYPTRTHIYNNSFINLHCAQVYTNAQLESNPVAGLIGFRAAFCSARAAGRQQLSQQWIWTEKSFPQIILHAEKTSSIFILLLVNSDSVE
jgi:hypothetical protein